MQRVRIGLTGLACVFVLVLLAAAFFGLVRPDEEDGADGGRPDTVATKVDREPKEPLAELGVTPGGGTPKQAPAPAPQPAQ